MPQKTILILGAGGFIGNAMVSQMKKEGYYVRGVDLKCPEYNKSDADEFVIADLRNPRVVRDIFQNDLGYWDEVFNKAADMGGAQFIFSGDNDADIMHNSAMINLNVAHACRTYKVNKLFYSSSACAYPEYNQLDPDNPKCSEDSIYPAQPDSEYGWEKIFSERIYLAHHRNYGLNVRIARFHNIFGEGSTYDGERAKAPAALCRKVALANDGEEIEVWGDGLSTRSFLYIDECIEGVGRLMRSDFIEPINIGSEEMVTVNQLAQMIIDISGKDLKIKNVSTNVGGVRGRNSDNTLIKKELNWSPTRSLKDGLIKTYQWVNKMVNK
jgi:nucleoside-diphosphate-sugar epimerase